MTLNNDHKSGSLPKNRSVWLLILAAISLVGIMLGTRIFVDYTRAINNVEERLFAQARMVDENLSANLAIVNLMLNNIIKELEHVPGIENSQLNKYLQTQDEMTPGIRTILVTDHRGRCLYSNKEMLIGREFRNRDYFKTPRDASDKSLIFLSPPYTTTLGKFVINITKPLLDKQGLFKGVVSIALEPEYFSTLLQSTIYAQDNRIGLTHSDGMVFIAMPKGKDSIVGRNLIQPDSPFFNHKQTGRSTSIQNDQITGENRVVAYITNTPKELRLDKHIVIGASRSRDKVLSLWMIDSALQILFYFLLSFATIILTKIMLKRREELARMQITQASILDSAGDGIIGLDNTGAILFSNRASERMTGWNSKELPGRNAHESLHSVTMCFGTDKATDCPICLTLKDGTARNVTDKIFVNQKSIPFPVEYTVTPLIEQKQVIGGVVVFRDITERKRLEDALNMQAHIDHLTGANNRGYLLELLDMEIERARRYGRIFCVLMLDLDNFKSVNDTRGHAAGDEALRTLTRVIQLSGLRQSDFWGRIGGEEFAVILPEIGLDNAVEVAERIRINLAETPVNFASETFSITASIGVSEYVIGDSQETLLHRADLAMYEAKQSGRNRVCQSF